MELMSGILAPGIFGAEVDDVGQELGHLPAEEKLMEPWGKKRRRDFILGRNCARKALAALGHGNAVIERRGNGAPLWPDGIVGSITHTSGYAAALVADARRF